MARECRLPGLAAWGRVRDWRLLQIAKLPNVELYLESEMTPETLAEFGADHIVMATGSSWRRDGVARHHTRPIPIDAGADVLTPDDILDGKRPKGKNLVIYDDDHYYMGGVIAELLRKEDYAVTLVTPSYLVSSFTKASLEQHAIQAKLLELDVKIEANSGPFRKLLPAMSRLPVSSPAAPANWRQVPSFWSPPETLGISSFNPLWKK